MRPRKDGKVQGKGKGNNKEEGGGGGGGGGEERLEPTPSPPPHRANRRALPASAHTAAYLPVLLTTMEQYPPLPYHPVKHFLHLPCSCLTTVPPPSLAALKQHAQALCLLTTLLQGPREDAWDFLANLYEPYRSKDRFSREPLESLITTLTPEEAGKPLDGAAADDDDADEVQGPPYAACPLQMRFAARTTERLIEHANAILTVLDDRFAEAGGLLAILPAPLGEEGGPVAQNKEASSTLLGQWIVYTRKLAVRIAEYEEEIAGLREVMRVQAEHVAVRARQTPNQHGESAMRTMVFPQDRYVLAGLSQRLWDEIIATLDGRRRAMDAQEASRTAKAFLRGNGPFGTDGPEDGDDENIVSWIETKSRLYRIRGHETVFVIPAFGLNPEADAVREIERGSLVKTIPMVRAGRQTGTDRINGQTAYERENEMEKDRLRRSVEELKGALNALRAELDDERRKRRKAQENLLLERKRHTAPGEVKARKARKEMFRSRGGKSSE